MIYTRIAFPHFKFHMEGKKERLFSINISMV